MRILSNVRTVTIIIIVMGLFWSCDVRNPEEIKSVVINEFMAVNDSVIVDEYGDYDDWIELYNTTEDTIFLSGYTLTDNFDMPHKYTFSDTSYIAPFDYLLIWADGEPTEGRYHTIFKLSGIGEVIGLYDNLEDRIDEISFSMQSPDISYGYKNDGGDTLVYFGDCSECITLDCETDCSGILPTPGQSNLGIILR